MLIEPETLQVLLIKKTASLCCYGLPLGPFFFMERTITGRTYLDMLENWLMPQMNEDSDDYVFQCGCLAYFHNDYLKFATMLDRTLWTRWCWIKVLATSISRFNTLQFFLVRDLFLYLQSPLIFRNFVTVSPQLWHWLIVTCWHMCGMNWIIG